MDLKNGELYLNKLMVGISSVSFVGILTASIVSFFICNIVFMISYPETFSFVEWVWFIPAMFLVILNARLGKGMQLFGIQVSPRIIGFILSNIVFVTVLSSYDTQPVSDWKYVWNAANEMADGKFEDGLIPGTYMHEIPYQLGLSFFESLFIRVFGSSYWILKALNLILLNFITWSTYHFSKRKASVEVANFAYVASCMFLCYLMTVGQFTNHQLGFVFLYVSLYLYERDKFRWCCCAGFVAACLNFVRPMGIMVVAAIVVYEIYRITKGVNYRKVISNLVGFYFTYKIVLFLLDVLLLNLNYTDEYISSSTRNLYHKISYTLYESKIDGRINDYNYNYEEYNQAYKEELIYMVVNQPKEIVVNIVNKMVRYLGLFDYLFEMTYDHDENIWQKYPIRAIYSMQWFQYVFFVGLALYGYVKYRKRKEEIDLYQIFFIGNTCVYVFVEAFSSYRFINYFYLLFLVGYGLNELSSYRKKVNLKCLN